MGNDPAPTVKVPPGVIEEEKRSPLNPQRSARWDLWLCVSVALIATTAFWMVHQALIDDAYITLSYARNLATALHWGLIPTEPANSATSPLNVVLLGAAIALLRPFAAVDPVWGLGVVFVGLAVAMAWWWGRVAIALRLTPLAPALGVVLVLLNPFVLSATGLEVLLIPTVLLGMLMASVCNRPVAFGVLSGLAVLTRLDLMLFVLPLALASAGVRRDLLRSVGAAIAVALPWFAWSWWHFGSAIPDTFVIKTLQRSFGSWTFGNGLGLYFERNALATAVTVVPAILGLVLLVGWIGAKFLRWQAGRLDLLPVVALGGREQATLRRTHCSGCHRISGTTCLRSQPCRSASAPSLAPACMAAVQSASVCPFPVSSWLER